MLFLSYKIKIIFIWFCLASTLEGMSHEIDRSFKLIFWGTELGGLRVKGEISKDKYSVLTNASGKSLISLLSRFEITSGAIGKISDKNELIPMQSITRWKTRGKLRETQLNYRDGRLVEFEASSELNRSYHIENPIGISNTIDPVSLVLWLLLERREDQICKQELLILDGFRMSELSFDSINISQDSVVCFGKIKRVLGFKNNELNKKPLRFKITYSSVSSENFKVSKVEVETIFGMITLE